MTTRFNPRIFGLLTLWMILHPGVALGDYKFYKGRTEYILVTTQKTWDQAEADAVAKGGHLVQINDATENSFILSKITGKVPTTAPDGGGAAYCWIGGKETATEGTYAWAGGPTFWAGGAGGSAQNSLYQNWGRLSSPFGGPEPDNYQGTQNRTAIALQSWPVGAASGQQIGNAGHWNDIDNTNSLYYVIERPISKPSEGLFVVFQMTHGGNPAGSFTCQLHYDKAPVTVANFITLVEGTRGWIDHAHGKVSTAPLYNGLKCHRIISGFMIQGGDPVQNGTGGPGYRFPDEFHADLRHDHPGVLSMANSGANTNGSQFFVTVAQTSHLDDKHSIFGEVVEGYESCVLPLSTVPTGANDVPVQDVRISSITIQRLGAAAQAFNPLNPSFGLPVCSMHQTRLDRSAAGALTMRWPSPAHCSYSLFDSPDLNSWSGQSINYYSGYTPPIEESLDVSGVPPTGAPRYFFNLAKVTYNPLAPQFAQGKNLILTGSLNNLLTTIQITTATGGTHRIQQAPSFDLQSTLSNVEWTVAGFDSIRFRSDIDPPLVVSGIPLTHSDWTFTFRSTSGGYCKGGYYSSNRTQWVNEEGPFTLAPIP